MKYLLFIVLLVAVVITAGCTNTPIRAPDPIVGHWGGEMVGIYVSLDAFSNGSALWTVENPLIGSMAYPVKWEKNPNGTYTIFTEYPFVVTISDDKMYRGGNITLTRGFVYTRPNSGTQNIVITPTSSTVISSSDPIIGIWQWTTNDGSKLYTFTFLFDGNYSFTDSSDPNTLPGTWSKVRENEYLITYTNGKNQALVYNQSTDTFTIPEFSQVLAYRLGKEPGATIPTTFPTTVETTVPTVTTTFSKEPIVGTWEYKLESGKILSRWTFRPEGTFMQTLTDDNFSQEGVWREVTDNRYETKFNADRDWNENHYIYTPQTDTVTHDIFDITIKLHRIYTTPTPTITRKITDTTTISSTNNLKISGFGDDVRSFTVTGSGLRIFTMSHTGTRNFAVVLKDSGGNYMTLLANEIGSYSGKKSERLTSGTYYLDITADGSWTIDISSM